MRRDSSNGDDNNSMRSLALSLTVSSSALSDAFGGGGGGQGGLRRTMIDGNIIVRSHDFVARCAMEIEESGATWKIWGV
jgi:hypothetical protein